MFVRNGQALGSILLRDAPKATRPKKQTPAPEPQPEKAAAPQPEPKPEPQPEPAKAAPAAKSAAPHKSTPSKEAK